MWVKEEGNWRMVSVADEPIKLSDSIGVDASSKVENSGEQLLCRADGALMGEKRKGRDQVALAE